MSTTRSSVVCQPTASATTQNTVDDIFSACPNILKSLVLEGYAESDLTLNTSTIDYNFTIRDSSALQSIHLGSIGNPTTAAGEIVLQNLSALADINLFDGFVYANLQLRGLPSIAGALSLPCSSERIVIEDTALSNVSINNGLETEMALLSVTGNQALEGLSYWGYSGSVGNITLRGEEAAMNVDFQSLKMAGSVLVHGAGFLSLSQLTQTTGDVVFENSSFSFLSLTALETVGGDLVVEGNVSAVGFQALKHVGRRMNINSTSAGLDCSTIDFAKYGVGDAHGSSCTSLSGGSTTDRHHVNRVGAIIGGVLGGLCLMVAFCLFLWLRRKKSRRKGRTSSEYFGRVEMEQRPGPVSAQIEIFGVEVKEVDGTGVKPRELEGLPVTRPSEMDAGGIAYELEGDWAQKI